MIFSKPELGPPQDADEWFMASRHQVTLVYVDRMFYYGTFVSLVSAAAWVTVWLRGWKRPCA